MIDAAFIVAFVLSLLKVGEIALRPHQKKLLQEKIEYFTVLLDDAYPSYEVWIKNLPTMNAFYVFLLGASISLTSAVVVLNADNKWVVISGLFITLGGLAVIQASGYWHYAPKIMEGWVPDKIGFSGFLLALSAIFIAALVLFAQKLIGSLAYLLLIKGRKLYFRYTLFPCVLLTASFAFFVLWLAKPLVRLTLAVLWRISEYQGGAWLAILFLATAALGVVKVFVGN